MKRTVWTLLALGIGLGLVTESRGDVKLPAVFGSHMVLQREIAVPVWGWAAAGEEVSVSFRDQTVSTKAGADGTWKVSLKPLSVGAAGAVTVKGKNTIVLENVVVGEVWVCSGQSNMQWSIQVALDPDLEVAAATNSNLRLFQVPLVTAAEPQTDVDAEWRVAAQHNVSSFTAVGYYFGRQLQETLGVPVGLIQTAWGGTRAEAWASPAAMAANPELKVLLDDWAAMTAAYDPVKAEETYKTALKKWEEGGKPGRGPVKQEDPNLHRDNPSRIYNKMIAPLAPYAIRGAIWYQGESNASRAYQYRTLMTTMIQSWRDTWKQGDFPFYQVQLANFREIKNDPVESDWAELREAQWIATQRLPKVGAVCITDIGAAKDIHPKDKQNVGKRLARLALHQDYGMKNIVLQGPTYKAMEVQGNKVLLKFDTYGAQLIPYYLEPLTGFAITGEDKKWVWGTAKIVEPDTIEVSHPNVAAPVAVRYNWADNPQGNLYNAMYLPAYPFRTDDWPGVTVNSVSVR